MIRPITVLTFILACGSGMYLYQAKHHVHMLDAQIDQTVRQTEALRLQTRALHAEWMLLNDPDRLHRLAAQYLTALQPVAPTQFTDLADLGSRLPAPVAPAPPAAAAPLVAAATAEPAATDLAAAGSPEANQDGITDRENADSLPLPPSLPAETPPADPAARPAIARSQPTDLPPRPVVAHARPHTAPRVADVPPARPQPVAAVVRNPQRIPDWNHAAPRPVLAEAAAARFIRPEPRPMPVMRPRPAPQPAFGGSLLGMARATSDLPPPRPVPLDTVYNSNSGG